MSGYRNVWGDNFASIAEIFDNHMARPLSRDEEGDEGEELEVDRILEEKAREMVDTGDAYFIEWVEENAKDFIPAMKAALAGDHECAARILQTLYDDWQDLIVGNVYRRQEVAEQLS